jgi:hypothetical protein
MTTHSYVFWSNPLQLMFVCVCVCVCVFYDNDVLMHLTLTICNSFVCILSFCNNGILFNLLWKFTTMCVKKKIYHNSVPLYLDMIISIHVCSFFFMVTIFFSSYSIITKVILCLIDFFCNTNIPCHLILIFQIVLCFHLVYNSSMFFFILIYD